MIDSHSYRYDHKNGLIFHTALLMGVMITEYVQSVPGLLFLIFGKLEARRVEDFFNGKLAAAQTLFIGILKQCFERFAIRLDAVWPKIFAHQSVSLFNLLCCPWQRNRSPAHFFQLVIHYLLGL